MSQTDFQQLFKILGITPDPQAVWKENFTEAFTHRSVKHKNTDHNERLEFLGDAILEMIVTEFLFHTFPHHREGMLTSLRSALVKKEQLAKTSRKIGLQPYMNLSKGEEKSGGREKDYLLANTFEALLGAIYISFGPQVSYEFVQKWLLGDIENIVKNESHIDPKSELQELTQADIGVTPHYKVIDQKGLDHEKQFWIEVLLDEISIGHGKGKSKKEAESMAAQNALEKKSDWFENFEKKSALK